MSYFQRIKNVASGVVMLLFALLLALAPEEAYDTITFILALSILVYGFRLLFFYFTMSCHMVGGKSTLYQAIIVLDLGLFTMTIVSQNTYVILIYLLGIYAFSGVVDILRAFEAKKNGASSWRFKLFTGLAEVIFALSLVVIGVVLRDSDILVYGYCLSLAYSAVVSIVTAFRKTAIVYIQ